MSHHYFTLIFFVVRPLILMLRDAIGASVDLLLREPNQDSLNHGKGALVNSYWDLEEINFPAVLEFVIFMAG